jgi:hypothetical protein
MSERAEPYRGATAVDGQVAFTLPMGLVFGSLRLHVLTNLPGAFGA